MKVLDVNVLQSGMDDTITDIDNLQGRISALQRAVRDFAGLDDALSGKGGEAIRAFYDDCHQPFLIFLHQSLIDYQNTLTELKEAVETFEPDENGYVSQEFLENDVKSGLDDVKTTAIDFTSEANSVIGSVQDIVSIGKIDESEVVDNVQRGKDKADHIVDELNILDEYGVSQLEQTKQDLDTMLSYLTEIESKFQSGDLSIRNFNVKAIQGLESFQTIQDSIYNKNQETISGLYGDDFAKMPMSEIEKRKNTELKGLNDKGKTILNHAFKDLQEGNIDRKEYLNILKDLLESEKGIKHGNNYIELPVNLLKHIPKEESKSSTNNVSLVYKSNNIEDGYLVAGEDEQMGEYGTIRGGVGYYKYDFADLSNPDSLGKIGGSSSVSLIRGGFELDTNVVDGTFTNNILTGTVTAQVGGSSVYGLNVPLPLLKAEGKAYELHGGYRIDESIPVLGGFGHDASGRLGNGKAYAGFDEGSVGLAAKTSLVEGDVSQIIHIPFINTDVKITLGGSAGSIGGEAKIGKEIMIDLRFVFGLKFGITFE